jgi:hypothetical protein
MSLYLALKTPSPKDAPAAFLAKKLQGYAPSPINQLAILGIARYPEVAYGMYRSHIDAFLYATITNEKVFAQSDAFSDFMPQSITIPFSLPPLTFSPGTKVSSDQAQILLKKLGDSATMKYVGKTLEYTVGQPLITDIPKYLKAPNPTFAVGPDRLSPLGFRTYIKACGLLEAFLATNYYPAFKDLEGEVPQISGMTLSTAGAYSDADKQYFYHYAPGLKRTSEKVADAHAGLKRRRIEKERDSEEQMEEDREELLPDSKIGIMTFDEGELTSSVVTAKPSGRPSNINWGPPGSVPSLPGLVFPYFKGLNRPDFVTIREVFVNFFFRLFGSTFEECKSNIADIKRGVNDLSTTEGGLEITHAMKGVELALKTQTRLYLLFDKSYLGFVLLGGRFAVYDGSKWISPVTPEEVQAELKKMDLHSAAVEKLALLMSQMKVSGTNTLVPINPVELSNATRLMEQMCIRDFDGYEKKDEFDLELQRLLWPTPYRQISPDTFLKFLRDLLIDKSMPDENTPMYIPSCQSPVRSPMFRLLASFGPDAPSLWNTRGDIISVLPDVSRKGKEVATEPPEAPKEIIVLPKPVLIAYRDWEKILKDRAVSFNFKERAKSYRAHVISSPEMRKKVWGVLREGLEKISDDAQGEPSRKKKKTDSIPVVSTDELLALW